MDVASLLQPSEKNTYTGLGLRDEGYLHTTYSPPSRTMDPPHTGSTVMQQGHLRAVAPVLPTVRSTAPETPPRQAPPLATLTPEGSPATTSSLQESPSLQGRRTGVVNAPNIGAGAGAAVYMEEIEQDEEGEEVHEGGEGAGVSEVSCLGGGDIDDGNRAPLGKGAGAGVGGSVQGLSSRASNDLTPPPVGLKRKGGPGAGGGGKEGGGDGNGSPSGSMKQHRSAWMLFIQDERNRARVDHPDLSSLQHQKVMGERWQALPAKEKESYCSRARVNAERFRAAHSQKRKSPFKRRKERVKSQCSTLTTRSTAAGAEEAVAVGDRAGKDQLCPTSSSPGNPTPSCPISMPGPNSNINSGVSAELGCPLGRLRRIIKLDTDVQSITKEATATIGKAMELFTGMMARESWAVCQQQRRKALRRQDIHEAMHTQDQFYWIKDDFPLSPASTLTLNKGARKASGSSGRGGGNGRVDKTATAE